MIKISKRKIYNGLALLFLINAAYFFFFPEMVHESPPFKFFKYFIYIVFMALTITYRTSDKLLYCLILIPLALFFFIVNSMANIISFINYSLPLLLFFSGKPIAKINWKWVIKWTLYISFFFGFYEILFLKNHYYMYNRGLDAYRVVSIFINPNNFGIIMALLSFAYIRYNSKGTESLIIYALSLLFVKLSGSKTGMVIFGFFSLYLLYFYFKNRIRTFFKFIAKGGIFILMLAIPAVIIGGYYFYETVSDKLTFRTFRWETLFIRFGTYFEYFATSGGNVFFPWYSNATYVDNIYLHLMGSFGAIFLLGWLIFNFYVFMVIRNRMDLTVVLFAFLLIGLTTNFLYVWPLSYMYWGFVGYIFYSVKARSPVIVQA